MLHTRARVCVICALYSQFELIRTKFTSKYSCFLFWGVYKFDVCYGPFSKIVSFSPELPTPTQLLLRGNVDKKVTLKLVAVPPKRR
jgi:hypothetical protein